MTKELRRCVSANILLGLITREQEAVLTDRRTAILKIMEDLKNECKWNWSSRNPGDRV